MLSGTDMNGVTWQGLPSFVIAGVGIYFLGRYFNVQRPEKRFADARAQHFGLVLPSVTTPGGPPETLPLDQQPPLTPEETANLRSWKNRHSLFFIPMQWWGFVLPVIGVFMTVANMR